MELSEAIEKIIESHAESGYGSSKTTRAILHLFKEGATSEKVSLLAIGYNPSQTEFLVQEGVDHHTCLTNERRKVYTEKFGNT